MQTLPRITLSKLLAGLAFGGLVAIAQPAQASLPLPTSGAHRVRLKIAPKTYQGLKSGNAFKVGQSIPMAIAFDLPQDSSCVVRVILAPVGATAEIPGRNALTAQGNAVTTMKEATQLLRGASLGLRSRIYQMSCSEFQVGSRVELPFEFKSIARAGTGSAADVSVEVFGGKGLVRSRGYATLVLAVDASQRLKISSSEEILRAQRERILKDSAAQLEELVSSSTLPLDVSTVPKTLSADMGDTAKNTGKDQE